MELGRWRVAISFRSFDAARIVLVAAEARVQPSDVWQREAERIMRSLLRRSEFLRGMVHAVRQLRGDLRRLRGVLVRPAITKRYLASHTRRRLQIGAGPNELEGWLNADFNPRSPASIYLDATQPFPLPSNSFDLIFSEHMIEHVPFDQGLRMLRECYRVLKPGGTIRLATPNMDRIAALATTDPTPAQMRYVEWAIRTHVPHVLPATQTENTYRPTYVINNFFWDFGHYFVYDPSTLGAALRAAGFTEVTSFEPGHSDINDCIGIESHASLIGEEFNRFETMVLQASKR